jgi:hypothetical protein
MHPHYPEVEITAEVMEQEAAWHEAREGNGAAPAEMEEADMEMEAAAVETVEMEYAEGEYAEEPAAVPAEEEYAEDYAEGTAAPEDGPNGAEEPKSTLAQRFAARRAKRQADKSGGGSLTSRLRGLVAESSETRT